MTKYLFPLLLISVSMAANAQSSCDPTCTISTGGTVSTPVLMKYKTNYEGAYRNSTTAKKTHSVSVDFSKEAINYFYSTNFSSGSTNAGINVFFLCPANVILPGHKHLDQIGLGIFPSDLSCKTNFTGSGIYNNSYDQKYLSYKNPKLINKLTQQDWSTYTDRYKLRHQAANPDNYTSRVHFNKDVLEALFIYINSDPKFTGIRFEFGIYKLPNMACGQKSDNQLTLFISPVLKTGATDYEGFLNFLKINYVNGNRLRILDTYNHGELCPKICPE